MSGEELVIRHTSAVIYARLGDGSKAYIKYRVQDGVMELISTYTPPQHRGKGIARRLMEYAVRMAEENGWLIKPICSYAIYYFMKHPEKRHLLVPELRDADLEELFKKALEEERREGKG